MGRYKDMRSAIVTVLEAVQLAGADAFAEVSTNPTNKFSGYPAATVVPAEVGSEFHTNNQNTREYGFNIYLHYPVKQGWSTAVDVMIDLLDACMDALDQNFDLNGTTDFLRAVPGEWDIDQSSEDLVLLATIHAIAVKDVDV